MRRNTAARALGAFLLVMALSSTEASATPGRISTFAGGGVGDGRQAVVANVPGPSAIAFGPDGSMYVADLYGDRIRKVAPDGAISTFAGTGIEGYFGDGGPATSASLRGPSAIEVAPDGTVYFADTYNHRIRKVEPGGTISTIVGTGFEGFNGDLRQAKTATLAQPNGIHLGDDGSLYIADTFNHRVRRVRPDGIIETVVGNGSAGYYGDTGPADEASLFGPTDVVVEPTGEMFVADRYNHRIRRVDEEGKISTFAGSVSGGNYANLPIPHGDGLPAILARLYFPTTIDRAADGSLIVADMWNHRVRRIDGDGVISSIAGTGQAGYTGDGVPATQSGLRYPAGIAIDPEGRVVVADTDNHRVRRISAEGIISTVAGDGTLFFYGDGSRANEASLYYPGGLAFDASGNLYVADSWNHRIRRIAADGTIVTVAGTGALGLTGDGGPALLASMQYPNGLSMDALGNLYVADTGNNAIRRIGLDGTITTVAGGTGAGYTGDGGPAKSALLRQPYGVTVGPDGAIYIADSSNHAIRKIVGGIITTVVGGNGRGSTGDGGPAAEAQLRDPFSVAFDAAGGMLITDGGNSRVRRVNPAGIIEPFAGNGTPGGLGDGGLAVKANLSRPFGLLVDPAGNVFITDSGNDRIRRVDPAGIITRVAGTPGVGLGDGGPALQAILRSPAGLALDAAGNLYVSDAQNLRVRRIEGPVG